MNPEWQVGSIVSDCCKKCRKRVKGNGAHPFYVCRNVRCECHPQLADKPIQFMRKDGSFAVNVVGAGGYDPETGEVIFHEIVGFSGDVKRGVYVDGKEKFKRILIQRVFPVIEDRYVSKEHNQMGEMGT